METNLHVHIDLEGKTHLVGRLWTRSNKGRESASFEYADAWLKKTPVSYPILLDPKSQVSQLYQVQAMPTTVVIDRNGIVRFVHNGYLPGDENQYMNSIRALIVQ